jgi:hypothetical protein
MSEKNRPDWCRDGDCEVPDKVSLNCFKCLTKILNEQKITTKEGKK